MQDKTQPTTQYTRCPQCETAFKVTAKMLSMAKGKVRCGACLAVFQATNYLLQPSKKTSTSTLETPLDESQANSEPGSQVTGAELKFESESMPDEVLPEPVDVTTAEIEEHIPTEATQVEEIESIEDQPEIELQDDLSGFELEQEVDVESETEEIQDEIIEETDLDDEPELEVEAEVELEDAPELEDDTLAHEIAEFETSEGDAAEFEISEDGEAEFVTPEDDLRLTSEVSIQNEPLDTEELTVEDEIDTGLELDTQIETDIEPDDVAVEAELDESVTEEPELSFDEIEESDEESLAEEGIQPENDLNEFEVEIESAAEQQLVSREFEQSEPFDAGEQADQQLSSLDVADSDELEEQDLSVEEEEEEGLGILATRLTSQINDTDTDPDPLDEFEERVEEKNTGLRNAVIAAVLVIILLIASLKFWNNRQQLAWDESWGAVTLSVCSVLPCDLKPRRDVSKIRLRQKIVTPSETKENSLDIKILLTNEASFDQPYPLIIIKFSNSDGNQVAVKRFEVKDYFPDKQGQLMPAGAEVHISFQADLVHPDALGFEFDFE